MILYNVRLRFGSIFTPRAYDNTQPEKYEATFIITPGSDAEKTVTKAMKQTAKEKWGDKAQSVWNQLKAQDRLCLRSGEIRDTDKYPEFIGKMFVTAKSDILPRIVDQDAIELTANDGRIQDGAIVHADISLWAQDNQQWGKRVNANLLGLQLVSLGTGEHDAPLGQSRRSDADTFKPLSDDEMDSDDDGDDILD